MLLVNPLNTLAGSVLKDTLPVGFDAWVAKKKSAVQLKLQTDVAESSIKSHISRVSNRITYIQNNVISKAQIPLDKVWTAPLIQIENGPIVEYALKHFTSGTGLKILEGRACLGKSTTMHKLFLDILNRKRLPFLIEFRRTKEFEYDILKMISEILGISNSSTKQISDILVELDAILLLDGLDEVPEENRQKVCLQIERMIESNSVVNIIISSRPYTTQFYIRGKVIELQPYPLEKICQIICKVSGESIIDSVPCKMLKDGLYQDYEHVFSNPLFSLIFLRSFQGGKIRSSDTKRVPATFYEDICSTLFKEHDLNKEFKLERKYRTDLSDSQFTLMHEWLSVSQCGEAMPSLSRTELKDTLGNVLLACGLKADPDQLLEDLVTAIGIVVCDSDLYEWMHRSFQEFYIAKFALRNSNSAWAREVLSKQWSSQSMTIQFLEDLNPLLCIENIDIPFIENCENVMSPFWELSYEEFIRKTLLRSDYAGPDGRKVVRGELKEKSGTGSSFRSNGLDISYFFGDQVMGEYFQLSRAIVNFCYRYKINVKDRNGLWCQHMPYKAFESLQSWIDASAHLESESDDIVINRKYMRSIVLQLREAIEWKKANYSIAGDKFFERMAKSKALPN